MLRIVVGYTAFRDDIQFLLAKQAYIHNYFWKTAFYIHVFSAIVALFYVSYRAVQCARQRDFKNHKNFMIRSYALTLSAITLRTWHIILSRYFAIDPAYFYIVEAWIGFVPNLIVAECMIRFSVYEFKKNIF